jgi:hypothetical protein
MLRKRVKIILISLISVFIAYWLWQWIYLRSTEKVPFVNLLNDDSDNCFIYFNIEHQGKTYPVVYLYFFAEDRFVSPRLRSLAPYYFNEIIKYDLNISVDNSTFAEIKDRVVNPSLISHYLDCDLLSDSSIIWEGRINKNIVGENRKAIIYSLLVRGINCCFAHETGDVYVVSRPNDK